MKLIDEKYIDTNILIKPLEGFNLLIKELTKDDYKGKFFNYK